MGFNEDLHKKLGEEHYAEQRAKLLFKELGVKYIGDKK